MEFQLVAHRGWSDQRPENTLAAFDFAVEGGWTNIETDVQLSSDLVPLIVHDEELKRVARPEQARTICCHPAEDLTDIDVGSWFSPEYHAERIPTLAAVLRRYRGRIHLHLEVKTAQDQLPGKVVEALTAAEWLHYASTLHDEPFAVPGLTLTSFHIQQLQRLGERLPGARLAWLVHEITDEVIREAAAAGVQQLCPRANIVSEAAVAKALQAGFSVRGWGIKDTELLMRMKASGAQGCTVNWPDRAQTALRHHDST